MVCEVFRLLIHTHSAPNTSYIQVTKGLARERTSYTWATNEHREATGMWQHPSAGASPQKYYQEKRVGKILFPPPPPRANEQPNQRLMTRPYAVRRFSRPCQCHAEAQRSKVGPVRIIRVQRRASGCSFGGLWHHDTDEFKTGVDMQLVPHHTQSSA